VIATGYGLEDHCSVPGRGKNIFSTPQLPDGLWGSPSLLPNGYRKGGSFPEVKRPECETGFSRLSGVEDKMVQFNLHSLIRLHGMVLN
jgi:hypothetical protein